MRYGWLIEVDQHDIVHCGSEAQVPCYHKSDRYIRQDIENMKKRLGNPNVEIYFLADHLYTQEVCEMNMAMFISYIRNHGRRFF